MLNTNLARMASLTVLLSMPCLSAMAQMTISGTPPATATVGKEYYFVPVVQNGNQKTLQFNYVSRPAWSGDYMGSGAIIGTPTAPGVYSNIQIQAWDGEHFAETAPFTITVVAAGTTPLSENLRDAGDHRHGWANSTRSHPLSWLQRVPH